MEKYLLCGEFMTLPGGGKVYKGRRRGTVEFVGIQKHDKTTKEEVANAVSLDTYVRAHLSVCLVVSIGEAGTQP